MKQSLKVCAVLAITMLLGFTSGIAVQGAMTSTMMGNTIVPNSAATYSPDGKGYLTLLASPNKYLMHLEGSSYAMGYQHGWLRAQAVQTLASTYSFKQILLAFVGVTVEESYDMLEQAITGTTVGNVLAWLLGQNYINQVLATYTDILDAMIVLIKDVVRNNMQFVPQELKDEMRGIADGATAHGYPVNVESVQLLNLGFDAILSFLYPIVTPLMNLNQFLSFHACDGFVATDHATAGGITLMGRNWMFTAYGLKDYSLMIEYKPSAAGSIKFMTSGIPGMVGSITGMNVRGIGIGIDMVPAFDCHPGHFGMGGPLMCRMAIQYKGELEAARDYLGTTHCGVSWLFSVGDGQGTNKGGVVVERSASWWFGREDNYDPHQWFPYVGWGGASIDVKEEKDDLVCLANNYIPVTMNTGAAAFILEDSVWRYNTVTGLCLAKYGVMTFENAKSIVDYAHPPNYGYYGTNPYQAIQGIRNALDLTNLKMASLYGYYGQPWVTYTLTP
jgi:hypothetical protein